MCVGGIWFLFSHPELPELCRQVMEVVILDTPAPPVCPRLTGSPPPKKKTKDRSLGPACPLGSLGAELSEARCSALLGAAEDVQPELEGTLGPHLPQSALSRSPLVSSILEVWLSSEATEFIRILGPLVGDP